MATVKGSEVLGVASLGSSARAGVSTDRRPTAQSALGHRTARLTGRWLTGVGSDHARLHEARGLVVSPCGRLLIGSNLIRPTGYQTAQHGYLERLPIKDDLQEPRS